MEDEMPVHRSVPLDRPHPERRIAVVFLLKRQNIRRTTG